MPNKPIHTSCNSVHTVRHDKLIVAALSFCYKQHQCGCHKITPVTSAANFSGHRHGGIIQNHFNIIISYIRDIIIEVPHKYVSLNYTLFPFIENATTSTRSAHHNNDTVTAFGSTDRL